MKGESLKGITEILEQIRDGLSRNKLKKILALILSITLWAFVMVAQNPVIEDSYRVKVRLRSASQDHKAFYNEQEVKVRLSAPRSYFIDYTDKDINAYIDTTDYGEGEYDIPVEAEFPKGFELSSISPSTVHVKIEPIIERQMELEVILSGAPKEGNVVKNIIAPPEVAISGAKSMVESVTRVIGHVGVVGDGEDFELNVPISAVDENGREVHSVRIIPASVKVFIDIEKRAKKTVPISADLVAPIGMEFESVTVSPSVVELEGAEDVIENIYSLKTARIMLPANTFSYKNELGIVLPDKGLQTNIERVSVNAKLKSSSITP